MGSFGKNVFALISGDPEIKGRLNSSSNASGSSGFRPAVMTMSAARRPCFAALRLEMFLPAAVRGPVDLRAFCRFASSCFGETSFFMGLCGGCLAVTTVLFLSL